MSQRLLGGCLWGRRRGTATQLGSAGHQIPYGGTFLSGGLAGRFLPRCCFLRGSVTRRCRGFASGLAYAPRADGCVTQFIEGIEHALGKHVEVADGVPVGGEPEEDLAVVGGDSNCEQVARRQGKNRVARYQLRTSREQRDLRPWHVGDHQVVLFAHNFR